MSDRHGWNSWDDYRAVHDSFLRGWDHFVVEDRLTWTETSTLINWEGVLVCLDGIEIHVTKIQDVEERYGRPHVQTSQYSYHVLRRVEGVAHNLFRYDNVHPHPNHLDAHHRHEYGADDRELLPVTHIGRDGWPTLGEVIAEAHGVWQQLQREMQERRG